MSQRLIHKNIFTEDFCQNVAIFAHTLFRNVFGRDFVVYLSFGCFRLIVDDLRIGNVCESGFLKLEVV